MYGRLQSSLDEVKFVGLSPYQAEECPGIVSFTEQRTGSFQVSISFKSLQHVIQCYRLSALSAHRSRSRLQSPDPIRLSILPFPSIPLPHAFTLLQPSHIPYVLLPRGLRSTARRTAFPLLHFLIRESSSTQSLRTVLLPLCSISDSLQSSIPIILTSVFFVFANVFLGVVTLSKARLDTRTLRFEGSTATRESLVWCKRLWAEKLFERI